MPRRRRMFRVAEVAQQVVGGFLLAGPFVVTEEVWVLAAGMSALNAIIAVGIVMAIGYGALYKADRSRDPEAESEVAGIPLRFVSLLGVSFGSVLVLSVVFDAPTTFGATLSTTAKVLSVAAIFSVIGAATADSLF